MAQATMTISVDEYERDRFNEFCAAAGMDASTAVRMFVKAVLRENRIPFEISGDTQKADRKMQEKEFVCQGRK